MKIHNTLGNGFQEVIYQRCLAIELQKTGLTFEREKSHPIYYDGIQVGTRRADFTVENHIIVALKEVCKRNIGTKVLPTTHHLTFYSGIILYFFENNIF